MFAMWGIVEKYGFLFGFECFCLLCCLPVKEIRPFSVRTLLGITKLLLEIRTRSFESGLKIRSFNSLSVNPNLIVKISRTRTKLFQVS